MEKLKGKKWENKIESIVIVHNSNKDGMCQYVLIHTIQCYLF